MDAIVALKKNHNILWKNLAIFEQIFWPSKFSWNIDLNSMRTKSCPVAPGWG